MPDSANVARCRILIADDHPIVRTAIHLLLEAREEMEVVAEAENGEDAFAKIARLQPDVALVDITMPKLNGIEVVRRLVEAQSRTRVVVCSMLEDAAHVRRALEAGAWGYVPKTASGEDITAAIRAVARGHHYVHPHAVSGIVASFSDSCNEGSLSGREIEVLRLIAHGFSNKEVAARLDVSIKTVETFRARALKKIEGTTRVDIVRYAAQQGWFDQAPRPATS